MPCKYYFSEIPNNQEGQEFVRLMKKHLNKDRYLMRVRGQHLKPGLNWRHYTYGQGIKDSTHLRVYINESINCL